ncbi:PREDICTED: protein phosphatase 1 regulatory subunit 37 [Nipponia nippon]|uniref:protein phosphatase 1 regulatory subunit 37 n=1 Tax=Nipponia nippon TaxID=128390 RepID=UPI000511214E|nr:PREDICTED: protein phosphatase 1 regulatory subunit 37 [Nipponia nippon]
MPKAPRRPLLARVCTASCVPLSQTEPPRHPPPKIIARLIGNFRRSDPTPDEGVTFARQSKPGARPPHLLRCSGKRPALSNEPLSSRPERRLPLISPGCSRETTAAKERVWKTRVEKPRGGVKAHERSRSWRVRFGPAATKPGRLRASGQATAGCSRAEAKSYEISFSDLGDGGFLPVPRRLSRRGLRFPAPSLERLPVKPAIVSPTGDGFRVYSGRSPNRNQAKSGGGHRPHVANDPAAAPAARIGFPRIRERRGYPRNVTVDEIMSAYKQACQKLNCKQIPKLLKQIQEFKDLAPRIDCLDLKGEKLDYKACEALEEIFKRVQFKIVDLEQTSLDEDGASALFDMIEYYESATHLNISFNKHIGTRGWQAAAHMMRKTNCLQYLDARNTPLLDHSAPFVARALRISSSLVVLHLENASLSGRPLMLLATALKMNMNLRELYLADNKLNGLQDSAQLGNLLKFNCYIQILDLRNNHILDSGLAYICEGLKEQRKGLVTLVLWNNQLTHTGMAYLGMTLPHTQSLETLNLGHNPIGNEGVRNLKNGLIGNRSVLRLGMASTKLTCEGAVAVAEFIAESPRLLRLDLRENEIKTGGLMALSLALKVNHSLLRLDLDREPKKESVKSFIETQKALLAEIQNGCKRNFILAKEKEEKEQKLQQSASMPEITVTEPLEEDLAEDGRDGSAASAPEEGEEARETPTASENGDAEPAEEDDGGDVTDSDSDTDEEADAGFLPPDSSPVASPAPRDPAAAPGRRREGERSKMSPAGAFPALAGRRHLRLFPFLSSSEEEEEETPRRRGGGPAGR